VGVADAPGGGARFTLSVSTVGRPAAE
jgi:hypothetical protein